MHLTGLLGMPRRTVGTILILYALFASILFAGLYLWNTQPVVAEATQAPSRFFALVSFGLSVAMFALAWLAGRVALASGGLGAAFVIDVLLAAGSIALGLTLGLAVLPVDPWSTAFAAVGWALGVFVVANLCVVLYWSVFNALRKLTGAVRPDQMLPDLLLGSYGKSIAAMGFATSAAYLLAGSQP
jgi:cytochrome c oxidase subunit I+III